MKAIYKFPIPGFFKSLIIKSKDLSFEKIVIYIFIFTFVSMIISQIVLFNSSTRAFLDNSDKLEGFPLDSKNTLYNEGSLYMSLLSDVDGFELKVLINGDQVSDLRSRSVDLSLKDNDVIEIESQYDKNVYIQIIETSKNLHNSLSGNTYKLKKGVNMIARIIMD